MTEFSPSVLEKINHYVYYLIDPRNGHIFYVGQGKGNRVFTHVRGELALEEEEDDLSEKLETIRQIRETGLEPIPVLHRHGMEEDTAVEVAAALIDIIPSLANDATSQFPSDRGPTYAKELQGRYEWRRVMDLDPRHKLLFIKIHKYTVEERGSLYEAVRRQWVLNQTRAETVEYVLAIIHGICEGVFKPERWQRCKEGHLEKLDKALRWAAVSP